MNAPDIAAAAFLVAVLVAVSIWVVIKVARRFGTGPVWTPAPPSPSERQQWQQARQESMQAVRDQWTCNQILQLPPSTESND